MIAAVKALHIAGLVVWCAGLLVLPLLLRWHRHLASSNGVQHNYTQFRKVTHLTYAGIATPAAVLAIAAGTALIFMAQVFEKWLLAKLALVAGMVLVHAWLGHLTLQTKERSLHWRMPWPALSWLVALPCMLGVLWLVLAKPDLQPLEAAWVPAWLLAPLALDLAIPGLPVPQEALP